MTQIQIAPQLENQQFRPAEKDGLDPVTPAQGIDNAAEKDANKPQYISELSPRKKVELFRNILVSTFYATTLVVFLLLLLILPLYIIRLYIGGTSEIEPSLLLVVSMCGSLGALFSTLVRLYQLKDMPVALATPQVGGLNRRQLLIYTLSAPVIGAISATCVYLVFAGQVFTNAMFPEFACKQPSCTTFHAFLADWGPKAGADYAKAILWGFAAGFAERIVPNALDKLGSSLGDKKD